MGTTTGKCNKRGQATGFRPRFFAVATIIGAVLTSYCPIAGAQLTDNDILALQQQAQQEGWTFSVGRNEATDYSLDTLGASDEEIDPDYDPGVWLGYFVLSDFSGCTLTVSPESIEHIVYTVEEEQVTAEKFTPGTELTIEAIPANGYIFVEWVIIDVSDPEYTVTEPTENPLTLTMDGDKVLAPVFFSWKQGKSTEDYVADIIGAGHPRAAKSKDSSLPATFDWRTQNALTPIKHQGACGSCWAFSTIGVVESLIKIKDGVLVDLSEQWLVSNNTSGYNCGGGWFAFQYFTGPDYCNKTGAILEQNFPYQQANGSPNCSASRSYTLQSWARVDKTRDVPTAGQLKQAIKNYGPIAVAVRATSAFQAYTGGVFNKSESGDVTHAVVLVGWDDTKGSGCWIMRNSWGAGWGENGYM